MLAATIEVRGKPGENVGIENELTCRSCGTKQLVQGNVPITDTELRFQPADQWIECLSCGGPLVFPVKRVRNARCAGCDWQAANCKVGSTNYGGKIHSGAARDYADVLDMALDLVDAIDCGELHEGDFSVRLPDHTRVEAYTWATRPEIEELARNNVPNRPKPNKFQEGLADRRLVRQRWGRER